MTLPPCWTQMLSQLSYFICIARCTCTGLYSRPLISDIEKTAFAASCMEGQHWSVSLCWDKNDNWKRKRILSCEDSNGKKFATPVEHIVQVQDRKRFLAVYIAVVGRNSGLKWVTSLFTCVYPVVVMGVRLHWTQQCNHHSYSAAGCVSVHSHNVFVMSACG